MSWGNDLVSVLVNGGYGTYNVDIGLSTNWTIPNGDGPYTAIILTGGTGAVRTQNTAPQTAYRRPGASLTVRHKSHIPKRKKHMDYIVQ